MLIIRGQGMNRQQRRLTNKQAKRDAKKLVSLYKQLLDAKGIEQEYIADKLIKLFDKNEVINND
jgi:hypothetical protein